MENGTLARESEVIEHFDLLLRMVYDESYFKNGRVLRSEPVEDLVTNPIHLMCPGLRE